MVNYSIIFKGTTDGGRTFHIMLNSDTTRKVRMRVYNTYFNYPEWGTELVLEPGIQYWNFVTTSTNERYVEFRDYETYEIVGLFGLEGDVSCKDYDYESYAKKIFNIVPGNGRTNIIGVFNEIVSHGAYSNQWVDVEKNDVVVDIGFNYGLFSTTSMIKKPSRIIGFEPNPKLVKIFKDNFKDETIEVYNYAVSDVDKKVTFYENGDSAMSSIKENVHVENRTDEIQIDAIGINTIFNSFNLERIDYLKVDCEGSEFEIFDSMSEDFLSTKIRKTAIEFHNFVGSEDVQKLLQKLKNCGFETFVKNDPNVPLGMIYGKK